jgi:transposase-like protein
MNVHKNARLTPHGRERIVRQVESGQTLKAVGEAVGVCPRTVRKWVFRYRSEGLAGLRDRSSRPHRLHRPTPQAVVAEVARLRRQRYTGQQIAAGLRISPAPSAAFCGAWGSIGWQRWSLPSRCVVTSGNILAN